MLRFAAFFLAFLLLGAVGHAQPQLGEKLHDFTPSVTFYPGSTGFDDTNGRYICYSRNFDREYSIFDRSGNLLDTVSFADDPDATALHDAFSGARSLIINNIGTWHIFTSEGKMQVWQVTDNFDQTASVQKTGDFDFATLITEGRFQAIDRASDGTWWVTTEDPDMLYHVSPSVGSIIDSWDIFDIIGGLFGAGGVWNPGAIGVDQVSNHLYLSIGDTDVENPFQTTRYVFRVSPDLGTIYGRFQFSPDNNFPSDPNQVKFVGGIDTFVWISSNPRQATEFAFPIQDLPSLTSLEFSHEGVFWTKHDGVDEPSIGWRLEGTWGGGNPVHARSAFPFFWTGTIGSQDIFGNAIESSFARKDLAGNIVGETATVRMFNDLDQVSSVQLVPFPIQGYNGDILFGDFATENQVGDTAVWSVQGVSPPVPLEGSVEFADFVPWVGGKRYGLEGVQASGRMEFKSKGEGSAAIGGGGEIVLGSGKLKLGIKGGATNKLTPEGLELTGGLVGISVAGTVSEEAGLLSVFPQLWPLRLNPLTGWALRWFEERAKFIAAITIGVDATTKVKQNMDGELAFNGQLDAFLALAVSAQIEAFYKNVKAVVLGEGKTTFRIIPNDSGFELSDIIFSFLVSGKIQIYNIVYEAQRAFVFSSERGPTRDTLYRSVEVPAGPPRYAFAGTSGSRSVDRMPMPILLEGNPFARMKASRASKSRATDKNPYSSAEVGILGNIPNGVTPDITYSYDGQMMAVWEQPVPGKPLTQATDLYYSFFNGSHFTTPKPINDDTQMDFAPDVHWRGNGKFAVAWARSSLPDFQPTGDPVADNATLIHSLVPAFASYDSETDRWSAVHEVPIEGNFAFNVQFTASDRIGITRICFMESSHDSMLPWDLNADPISSGRLGGVTLTIARLNYDEGTIRDVVKLGEDYKDGDIVDTIVTYSAAYGGAGNHVKTLQFEEIESLSPLKGIIGTPLWRDDPMNGIYGYQMFGGFSTTGSMEFSPQMRGVNNYKLFSGSTRIATDPDAQDFNPYPSLVASVARNFRSANRVGVQLPMDFADDYDITDPKYSRLSNLDYYRGINAGDRAVVVYPSSDALGNSNLSFQLPDSKPRSLQNDDGLELVPHLNVSTDGDILVSYLKNDVSREMKTVEIDRETTDVLEITQMPMGRISIMSHRVVTDIRVRESGLLGGTPNPGEPITVYADIENVGDIRTFAPRVNLYGVAEDDSRGIEMVLIAEELSAGSESNNAYLYGNETVRVEAPWSVPDDRAWSIVAVADPANFIEEEDEDNNMTPGLIPLAPQNGVVEHLLGRLPSIEGLDENADGVVDPADI